MLRSRPICLVPGCNTKGYTDVAITFPLISSAVMVIDVATLLGLTMATAVD